MATQCFILSIFILVYAYVTMTIFLLQTLLAYSTIGTISLFVVFSVLASVAALLLPIETRGRALKVNNHYQTIYPAVCYCSLTDRILVDDITKKYIHELNLIFNIKFNIVMFLTYFL